MIESKSVDVVFYILKKLFDLLGEKVLKIFKFIILDNGLEFVLFYEDFGYMIKIYFIYLFLLYEWGISEN